jgi:transposase InsO family protein
MSAATIDRFLRAPRQTGRKKRRRVVPEIRRRVPVRTFADWHEPPPGSMEMDLVAHCGESTRGSYIHSLVLTDIASGWTESAPLVVRERTLLVETLDRIRLGLPFPLRALDVDNGSEFINETMIEYCLRHGIELTRSRPYRKNDQAWIEQKNGAVVRRLLGYRRFEGIGAAQVLARLYGTCGCSSIFSSRHLSSPRNIGEAHRLRNDIFHPRPPANASCRPRPYPSQPNANYAKSLRALIRCNCSGRNGGPAQLALPEGEVLRVQPPRSAVGGLGLA